MKGWFFKLTASVPLFFLLISPSRPSPQQDSRPQKPLRHEVSVALKLIQVYVTDKDGKSARDLEKTDFVLSDNDQPRIITEFEKHFLFVPETALKETKPAPARDTSSLMNRKFIFLIDFDSNDLEGIAKATKAALHFMDNQVQSGDEIALLSVTFPSGLTLHEYLTSDHQKIRAALGRVLGVPGTGGGWDSFASMGHSLMGMEALDERSTVGLSHQSRTQSLQFTSGLTNLAKAFRYIPGQKNIILFSRGFGVLPLNPKNPARPGEKEFLEMGQELASANSPVFAVDTTAGMARAVSGTQPEPRLEFLSRLTGGKYYKSVDNYAQIAEDIRDSTSNYYVLGYAVASSWDGRFHEIKVDVKRQGYKVYAQRGYFNPLPFAQLSPIEKHLHLLNLALGEKSYAEQRLNFPTTALPFSDDKDLNTILLSEIPARRIRDEIGSKTEFISLIFDENKSIVDSRRVEIDWAAQRGETVCQYSAAALAPGRYDVRVVIRDLETGKGAVGSCAVEIPEKAASSLKLYPPLLLAKGPEVQYLHIAGGKKDQGKEDVLLSGTYPYPAKEFHPLAGELRQGTPSVYAVLRVAGSRRPGGELKFEAWLTPEGPAEKIPLTFELMTTERRDPLDILFLELKTADLPPGTYSLIIRAEAPAAKTDSTTRTALVIR